MEAIEITEEQANVLAYLKNMKHNRAEYYEKVRFYGVHPNDIIKLIERPDDCGRFPFTYVCDLFEAIKKINKNFVKAI